MVLSLVLIVVLYILMCQVQVVYEVQNWATRIQDTCIVGLMFTLDILHSIAYFQCRTVTRYNISNYGYCLLYLSHIAWNLLGPSLPSGKAARLSIQCTSW